MKKHIAKIKEVAPELAEDSEIQEAAENLERAEDFSSILRSRGGSALVDHLAGECSAALHWLIENYKTSDHATLMAGVANLEAHYNLLATIKGADSDAKELQKELDQLIVNKQM